jgi:hypothetical protein
MYITVRAKYAYIKVILNEVNNLYVYVNCKGVLKVRSNLDMRYLGSGGALKHDINMEQLFVEMENAARKLGLQINQEKTKYMIVERKNCLKQNENRTFEYKKLQI